MYEVEVKFPVADMPALHHKLVALAGRFREPLEQVDRYFAHPARDFVRTDEALRLRRVGHDVAITYRTKSALRDAGKALGIQLDVIERLAKATCLPLSKYQAEMPSTNSAPQT